MRIFSRRKDPPDANGLHWIDFGSSIALKEVIIGAQCHPSVSKMVVEAIRPYGDAVKCCWSGMRRDGFRVIKLVLLCYKLRQPKDLTHEAILGIGYECS